MLRPYRLASSFYCINKYKINFYFEKIFMPTLCIFIVDDHTLFVEGLQSLLNHESDMRVVGVAQDGHNLLQHIEPDNTDVVILDIQMPYNGLDTLHDIKRSNIAVRVLMLTGFNDQHDIRAAINMGADGVAFKSDGFLQIANAVRQVARGQLVYPRMAQRWLISEPTQHDDDDLLSPREMDVLSLVSRGLTNSEIARKLDISKNTVGFHLKNIFTKLNVTNRTEATVWYFANRSSFS